VRRPGRDGEASTPLGIWPSVHAAWVDSIDSEADLGTDRARLAEYASDLVETLFLRPEGTNGALTRFGRRLGSEGWPLEQVSGWIDWLSEICRNPRRDQLRSFRSGVALAQGWTEGNLRGMQAEECFDAVTGLCTTAVLRLRLQQVFEQCSALQLTPNSVHRLVIIDADVSDVPRLEADAVMVVLADLVQQHFAAGETIARDAGRIFVLVPHADDLDDRVAGLLHQAGLRSLLHAARILGWVEDLPASSTQIDGYMADLAV
jgi:GGDEF domain-containing protein